MSVKVSAYHGNESGKFKLTIEREGFIVEIIMDYNELMELTHSLYNR